MTIQPTSSLHLSLIPGVGPATGLKILKSKHSKELYSLHKSDFVHVCGLSQREAGLVFEGLQDGSVLEKELELIEKYKITVLNFLDEAYPESLKQIHLPPLVIYCKGAPLDAGAKRIAIVGSRKADRYAQKSLDAIVPTLVENDYEIVSGGATGADTMAHRAALANGGKTIAVFGAGLMCPYPYENKDLFRKIVTNGGTLLSSFSLQTPPAKGNFPARNRIISGLSDGCLIVQAAKRSGALITAHFALDQGKQIFALPGDVENELSAGPHWLIKQGAKLVADANDILEEFGETAIVSITKKNVAHEPHPIIEFLDEPISIDELCNRASLELDEAQGLLFQLQLEGVVKQNFAGLWEADY